MTIFYMYLIHSSLLFFDLSHILFLPRLPFILNLIAITCLTPCFSIQLIPCAADLEWADYGSAGAVKTTGPTFLVLMVLRQISSLVFAY